MEGYVGIHEVSVQESVFRVLSRRVEELAINFLHDDGPFYGLMCLTVCKILCRHVEGTIHCRIFW